eukprot:2642673-Rhodomonas_salina.5
MASCAYLALDMAIGRGLHLACLLASHLHARSLAIPCQFRAAHSHQIQRTCMHKYTKCTCTELIARACALEALQSERLGPSECVGSMASTSSEP